MDVDADVHVVTVAGPQTIREAAHTHAMLLSALQGARNVALECAAVTEVDLSFIQILIAARRSAEAAGRNFALRQAPQGALLEALFRGGFLRDDGRPPAPDPALWFAVGAQPT